ncbi:hypothetical protein [Pseudothauera rhizosphaerae]|uniref:Uncharacterized protein n=1 Tax=Pseudothauera rhizosphaerae TaxID=2565932 RepID=A0A4S4APK8_9RHOO|nr:hypothetical protein [Pseudothauera rhizosphaerae]THF61608.1 hypothetical protein E6O51_09135 [Pseudothauera rhizosphaerae]
MNARPGRGSRSFWRRFVCMAALALGCFAGGGAAEAAPDALASLARQTEAGTFRRFDAPLPAGTGSFSELLRVDTEDGKSLAIHGWSDSGHWDPKRKRAYFLGLRRYLKFICFDERRGAWLELGWQGDAPARYEQFGHIYGRTALDWRRGHYYRLGGEAGLYRYLIDEERWEALPGAPVTGFVPMEWHYGLDRLVALGRGGHLFAFRDGEWTRMGRSAVDGYHSLARFNAKRGDMLVAGGNDSPRKVDLIDGKGTVRHLRDAPFDMLIKNTDLSYDPVSGNYLVFWSGGRVMYELDPERDEWRLAAEWNAITWPFGYSPGGAGMVPIPIDEYGVILWLHESGALVYRHRSVFH